MAELKEMKALVVYAHQSASSFNAAVKKVTSKTLSDKKFKVEESDLYAMNFKATATAEDITGEVKDCKHFQYAEETELAFRGGKLSADIIEEQRKLTEADLVIFQFPMYWFSVPAIMKGWIDRVLTKGYAFSAGDCYSQGLLKGKKAILSFTTGSQESMFKPSGIHGDINVALWPLQHGTLHYCGFQVLAPQIFWSPASASEEVRATMLEKWVTRLGGLMTEESLWLAPLDYFDKEKGFELKTEIAEKMSKTEFGLTVGTHLYRQPPTRMKDGV